jgi:glucose/mannose-6-phosphate isomerase
MVDLDDKKVIAEIDKSNAYSSVVSLAKQCRQAWSETQELKFPLEHKNVKNVVLCGMGGSAYAAFIIKSLFDDVLKVPFELVNGYHLPSYVNEDTLVLLSSYSGGTEEAISCANEAVSKNAKISGVTNGSKLGKFLKDRNLPGYIFDAKYNPAKQPRLGQGYMIIGHIGILKNIGLIELSGIEKSFDFLEKNLENIENEAKSMAKDLEEKIPVFVSSEHLSGNSHIIRNQTNENSKNFATYSLLPELNHHLMEGLSHPEEKVLKFVFFLSELYSPIIKKRVKLTQEVVGKNGVDSIVLEVKGSDKVEQMLYVLAFGGYLTFYLAISYGLDPSPIPWVDYFKNELRKA